MGDRTCLVNVMIRVTKDVNDNVVVPSKQSKSFGNLVSTLLEGYYTNNYVRAFVEGKLDQMEEESSKQFNEQLNKMMGSISSMGIFTDELKSINEMGTETFSETAKEKEFVKEDIMGRRVESLERGMEELNDQNTQILELLKKLSSGAVIQVVEPVEEEPVEEVEETKEEPYEEDTYMDMKSFNGLMEGMFAEG